MSVSIGNGVDLGNLVTSTTNPVTGAIEIIDPETGFKMTFAVETPKQYREYSAVWADADGDIAIAIGSDGDLILKDRANVNKSITLAEKYINPKGYWWYGADRILVITA